MITEAILNLLFGVADKALGMLPEISWTVDTSAWDYLHDIMSMCAYLLPLRTIKNIIAMLLAILGFRILVALWRAVLGLIPFA